MMNMRLINAASIILPVALAACVTSSGNGILPAGTDIPKNAVLTISAPLPQVRSAVAMTLTNNGYRVGDTGAYAVDAAYSERPLTVQFETEGSLNSANTKPPALAICSQRIQRLSVVITDVRTGRPVYQGQAEATRCPDLTDQTAALLSRIALAKIRNTTLTR